MDGAAAVSNDTAFSCKAGRVGRIVAAAVTRSERTKNCGLREAPDYFDFRG